jgi:hypothetical protein
VAENQTQPDDIAYYNGAVAYMNGGPYDEVYDGLMARVRGLADAFAKSSLYADYLVYKADIERDPILSLRVSVFKEAQAEYERMLAEGTVAFDDEKRISHMYAELMLDGSAGPYLECETKLLDLYRNTLDTLAAACMLDI